MFHYKCTGFYSPKDEMTLRWNDPEMGIEWPVAEPTLSEKDAKGLLLTRFAPARSCLPEALTMNRPAILIIGKIGQVGWELRRTLAPIGTFVSVDYPEIDLTDGASIRKWVSETAPQVIINAAAYTAVDKAETETRAVPCKSMVSPREFSPRKPKSTRLCWCITRRITFTTARRRTPYTES